MSTRPRGNRCAWPLPETYPPEVNGVAATIASVVNGLHSPGTGIDGQPGSGAQSLPGRFAMSLFNSQSLNPGVRVASVRVGGGPRSDSG